MYCQGRTLTVPNFLSILYNISLKDLVCWPILSAFGVFGAEKNLTKGLNFERVYMAKKKSAETWSIPISMNRQKLTVNDSFWQWWEGCPKSQNAMGVCHTNDVKFSQPKKNMARHRELFFAPVSPSTTSCPGRKARESRGCFTQKPIIINQIYSETEKRSLVTTQIIRQNTIFHRDSFGWGSGVVSTSS